MNILEEYNEITRQIESLQSKASELGREYAKQNKKFLMGTVIEYSWHNVDWELGKIINFRFKDGSMHYDITPLKKDLTPAQRRYTVTKEEKEIRLYKGNTNNA